MGQARNAAVLVYEKVDLLDLAGPLDVFGISGNGGMDFRAYTVAERKDPVITVSGLSLNPRYAFDDCPVPDILIVPGGLGSRTEMHNESLTDWIRKTSEHAEMVISVCTGALLLAKANVLGGLRVTTNRRAFDLLREVLPADATVVEEVRYVDNGKYILSAGVTAGFDAALHAVARLLGERRAAESASRLEYRWLEGLAFARARPEDSGILQQLYQGAAQWILDARGIVQWRKEAFTEEVVDRLIREDEVFIARMQGAPVGALSIQWAYEELWGELYHDNAGYVHKLAVSRSHQGQGIGSRLLAWAKDYIKDNGKEWLRLDCMADNPALNRYYLGQGFLHKGRIDAQGWSANLYEVPIEGMGN